MNYIFRRGGACKNLARKDVAFSSARLIGIDSAATTISVRVKIWQRLATELHPHLLQQVTRTIPFSKLPEAFQRSRQAQSRGRVVVEIVQPMQ